MMKVVCDPGAREGGSEEGRHGEGVGGRGEERDVVLPKTKF